MKLLSLKQAIALFLFTQLMLVNSCLSATSIEAQNDAAEYDQAIKVQEWRLPIQVQQYNKQGLLVGYSLKRSRDNPDSFYLISINGQALCQHTPSQIYDLLRGRPGESALVGMVKQDGSYQEATLPYELMPLEFAADARLSKISDYLSAFDGRNGIFAEEPYDSSAYLFAVGHLDLLSVASSFDAVNRSRDLPGGTDALIDFDCIRTAAQLLQFGQIDKARPLLTTIAALPVSDSQPRRRFDPHYSDLWNALNNFNMPAETVKIGTPVIGAEEQKLFVGRSDQAFEIREVKFPAYMAYANGLNATNDSRRGAFTAALDKLLEIEPLNDGNATIARANMYARAGQLNRAIELYKSEITRWQAFVKQVPPGATGAPKIQLQSVMLIAGLLSDLAYLDLKNGDRQNATLHLTQARELFEKEYTTEQLKLIGQIPLVQISPELIEKRLKNIQAGEKPEAIDLNVVLHDYQDRPQVEPQFARDYLVLDAALAASKSAAVGDAVNELIQDFYIDDHALRPARPAIDQYCALLHAARLLARHNYLKESNQVLASLTGATGDEATPTLRFFVQVEKAINEEIAGARGWKHWQKVWSICDRGGISQLDLMRGLGCLMIAAHEPERATVLINATDRLCRQNISKDKYASFTAVLLTLDRAQIECDGGHCTEAAKLFNSALGQFDRLKIEAASRGLSLLNKKILYRAALIAAACHREAKSSIAGDILGNTIRRLEAPSSWLGVARKCEYPLVEYGVADVYAYMSVLLCEDKRYDVAGAYINKAIKYYGESVPRWFYLMGAQCAAALGDNVAAYQNYSKYVDLYAPPDGCGIMSVQPGWKEIYLRKALHHALAAGVPASELVKCYTNLAGFYNEPGRERDKLEALRSAYANMAGDTQEKKNLAQDIAQTLDQIGDPELDGSTASRSAESIKLREQVAAISAKSKDSDEAMQWLYLAQREIQAKEYDGAIAHLFLALKSMDVEHRGFVTERGMCGDAVDALKQLTIAKHAVAVDSLFTGLLRVVEKNYGDKSFEYTDAQAQYFAFLARTKQTDKALGTLDKILSVDPRKQELGLLQVVDQTPRSLISKYVLEIATDTSQIAFANVVADKLVTAQRQTYGSDDYRTGESLTTLARIELQRGLLKDAEKHAREALAIDYLYRTENVWQLNRSAANVLQDVLAKESRTADLEKLNNDLKARASVTLQMTAQTEDDSKRQIYEWYHANGPYNLCCAHAGMALLHNAVKAENWIEVERLAPECIVCLAHNHHFNVDSCMPDPSPALLKYEAFVAIIKACVNQKQDEKAKQWLKRAVDETSYQPSTDEYVFLSKIERECGNDAESLRYCRLAEEASHGPKGSNLGEIEIEGLYMALGQSADVERLMSVRKAALLKRANENARDNSNILKEQLANQPQHKIPPAADARVVAAMVENDKSDDYYCIEPVASVTLPSVETVENKFLFNYAAFAPEGLILDPGASVRRTGESGSYSFAGSYNTLSASQPIHGASANDFLFVYDGGPDVPLTKAPPIMTKGKLPPSLVAPEGAKSLPVATVLKLDAGDYKCNKLEAQSISVAGGGRVRIFVGFESGGFGNAIDFDGGARVNAMVGKGENGSGGLLEIWYGGSEPLFIGENAEFNGLIYAPNAEIKLERGVIFRGAMVGRKITAKAGSRIYYDEKYKENSASH